MSVDISKATLSKEVDGVIYAIYPKSSADMIIYDANNSVEDKITALESSISNTDARISNLINGGNSSTSEVVDARVAISDNVTYSTLKDRIDADYKALERRIRSLEQGFVFNGLGTNDNYSVISSDGTEYYLCEPYFNTLRNYFYTEISNNILDNIETYIDTALTKKLSDYSLDAINGKIYEVVRNLLST